jgi:hypothetical protein
MSGASKRALTGIGLVLLGLLGGLIFGLLWLAWTIIRAILAFCCGLSTLAALVGLGLWEATGNPNAWAMFAKSSVAALITGGLLIAALIPVMLWSESTSASRPLRLYPPEEPFDG